MSVRPAKLSSRAHKTSVLPICCILFFLIGGCGAPGELMAPSANVPADITNLSARQNGDGVHLTFSMPVRSVSGDRLVTPFAIEILRGTTTPDGSPDLKSLRVVDTIPDSLTGKYLVADKIEFTDPLAPEEISKHPGSVFVYAIRTRLSQKRASANSNVVSLRLFRVPDRVASLEARVTESAIELSWPPVQRTSAGEPLAASPQYNIYRAEVDAARETQFSTGPDNQRDLDSKLQLLTSQSGNTYGDKNFEFGKSYAYVVRAGITEGGTTVESTDSAPAFVNPRDVFPPAPPQDLAAVVLPGDTPGYLLVDLSWSISVEPDFAGYRVYRSEDPGTRGQLLNSELLPTPSLRDTSVQSAHRYWYAVTAVDRAGNESAPSPPVAVEVSQPSP